MNLQLTSISISFLFVGIFANSTNHVGNCIKDIQKDLPITLESDREAAKSLVLHIYKPKTHYGKKFFAVMIYHLEIDCFKGLGPPEYCKEKYQKHIVASYSTRIKIKKCIKNLEIGGFFEQDTILSSFRKAVYEKEIDIFLQNPIYFEVVDYMNYLVKFVTLSNALVEVETYCYDEIQKYVKICIDDIHTDFETEGATINYVHFALMSMKKKDKKTVYTVIYYNYLGENILLKKSTDSPKQYCTTQHSGAIFDCLDELEDLKFTSENLSNILRNAFYNVVEPNGYLDYLKGQVILINPNVRTVENFCQYYVNTKLRSRDIILDSNLK